MEGFDLISLKEVAQTESIFGSRTAGRNPGCLKVWGQDTEAEEREIGRALETTGFAWPSAARREKLDATYMPASVNRTEARQCRTSGMER